MLGSLVALATPMRSDGSVDFEALERLVEWQIEQGTNAIVSVGTTGESATLTTEEHIEVIKQTVRVANKRVPVIAGTGSNATHEAVDLTQGAAEVGADACLVVTPYYVKPTQHGMVKHFEMVAEKGGLDVVLYNVPGRTAVDLQNETVVELSQHHRIVGIKDATGDVARGTQLIQQVPNDFLVYSGDDETAIDLILAGAKGNISVTANVMPKLMSKAVALALEGRSDEAKAIDSRLAALHTSMFLEANPIPVKFAISHLGFGDNHLRLPLTSLSETNEKQVLEALRSLSE